MTKVHAYLARIKDQEKDVIAVPDGAGRALCISSDKHWTLTREWDELHIIAPLVEDEGNDDELERLEKALAASRDAHQRSADAHMEWKARAEAAEVRTTLAVTRADIEKAVAEWVDDAPEIVNEVWSLVSGSDPAVFVVRESDIAAVKVEQDEDGGWEANGDLVAMRQNTAEALRGWSLGELQLLARYEAVARAIEAEQAEDPIMVRTRELLDLAYPGDYVFTGAFETCRKIAEAEARLEDRHVDQ